MTFHTGEIQLLTAWVNWVNHKYHITPSLFHIFYQCNPIATIDHIMPIGMTSSYNASNQIPNWVTGAYSLTHFKPSQEAQYIHVIDIEILSAFELIESAQYNPFLYEECRFRHNVFVRGHTSHWYGNSLALYVDLERDLIRFLEDKIETSVDTDSIIWMMKVFWCKGIYITLPFQTKPSIFKHNHTYVNIIILQSEENTNNPGGRIEWLSKIFPISAVKWL